MTAARRQGVPSADCEDAAQEALIKAHGLWGEAVTMRDPDTWVANCLFNAVKNFARSLRSRREAPLYDVPAARVDIEGAMDAEAALTVLSERDAEILVRSVDETSREIAGTEGVTQNAMKLKLWRLKKVCTRTQV